MRGEHVKQNGGFFCFFDLFCECEKLQICGRFCCEFASHVHWMFTGKKIYAVEGKNSAKNLVFGLLIHVLVNVYEGYSKQMRNFALYKSGLFYSVKQIFGRSPFASQKAFCFTGGCL